MLCQLDRKYQTHGVKIFMVNSSIVSRTKVDVMAVIVKRRGKKEKFDEKKVYASVYSACVECDLTAQEAERIADNVTSEVKKFVKGKKQVNSTQIFGLVIQKLAKEHEAVAFMYETHREVIINN
ncbi:hypothetical protein GF318_00920 [Candidatus Micrarchaeota archaeon]|nr:hypothetical protein [Candidatus Micrarchaeota archaeon]